MISKCNRCGHMLDDSIVTPSEVCPGCVDIGDLIKAYMVCDHTDKKAASMDGCPNVGIEHLGKCGGRILSEDGTEIGRHFSSTYGFLRSDLKYKLDKPENYEIIDLIGQPVPERFRLTPYNGLPDGQKTDGQKLVEFCDRMMGCPS